MSLFLLRFELELFRNSFSKLEEELFRNFSETFQKLFRNFEPQFEQELIQVI